MGVQSARKWIRRIRSSNLDLLVVNRGYLFIALLLFVQAEKSVSARQGYSASKIKLSCAETSVKALSLRSTSRQPLHFTPQKDLST